MRTTLLFIGLLTACLSTSAQIDSVYDGDGNLVKIINRNFNRQTEFYKDGSRKADSYIHVNSSLEAAKLGRQEWFQNGELAFVSFFDDTTNTSFDNYYYPNGQLKVQEISELVAHEDSLELRFRTRNLWCENGFKYASICFSCDSIEPFLTCHCNGKVYQKSNFYRGMFIGDYREYHENGTMAIMGQFKDYFSIDEISVLANKKVGKWEYFDGQGKLLKSELYTELGDLKEITNPNIH